MSDYAIWKRKPHTGALGHGRIYVLVDKLGEPARAVGRNPDAQCSTLDRIPFVIPIKRLKDHYEPED